MDVTPAARTILVFCAVGVTLSLCLNVYLALGLFALWKRTVRFQTAQCKVNQANMDVTRLHTRWLGNVSDILKAMYKNQHQDGPQA